MKKTLIATAVASMMSMPAMAADITMKFGHVGAPGSLFEATVNHFAQCVGEKSGGKVEVQTFGSSQLGNATSRTIPARSTSPKTCKASSCARRTAPGV